MDTRSLLRVSGLIAAVISLALLARGSNAVEFPRFVSGILDQASDFLRFVFPTALFDPAFQLVRSFDIALPTLHETWRNVFLLLWFMFSVISKYTEHRLLCFAWSFLVAFATGIGSGMTNNSELIVGIGLTVFFSLHPLEMMGNRLLPVGISIASGIADAVLEAVGMMPTLPWIPTGPASSIITYFTVFGTVCILYGINSESSVQDRFNNPVTETGLEIMSFMGLAFVLAVTISG